MICWITCSMSTLEVAAFNSATFQDCPKATTFIRCSMQDRYNLTNYSWECQHPDIVDPLVIQPLMCTEKPGNKAQTNAWKPVLECILLFGSTRTRSWGITCKPDLPMSVPLRQYCSYELHYEQLYICVTPVLLYLQLESCTADSFSNKDCEGVLILL